MSFYKILFSPTGGTRRVVDRLMQTLGPEMAEVDLTSRETDFSTLFFSADDVCLVAVPSYGGRVPAAAAERLQRISGNGSRAVLVVVYGNRAIDDTLLELKEMLQKRGFRCVAAVAAVAEHSVMHQFGKGRPDVQDDRELADFAEEIRRVLAENAGESSLAVPGSRPYREYKRNPMKLDVSSDCTCCGTCARLCPVGAIPQSDPTQTDRTLCISCMRCVAVCPGGVRRPDERELAAHIEKLRPACGGHKPNILYL